MHYRADGILSSIEAPLREKFHYLPKDFVSTACGHYFAVVCHGIERQHGQLLGVGNRHARQENAGRDVVLVQLRYIERAGELHKLSSAEALSYLHQNRPQWLYECPRREVQMQGLPVSEVAEHYVPSRMLEKIAATGTSPALTAIAKLFSDSTFPVGQLGVTGSHLIGAAKKSSDIDLVVYGQQPFQAARQCINAAMSTATLQSLTVADLQAAYRRRGCSLSFEEFAWHQRRKQNMFNFCGTKCDLGYVDWPLQQVTSAGRKIEMRKVTAVVTGDRHAFATPAVYRLDHPNISTLVSFTPTYAGQALPGETIEAVGWVEQTSEQQRLVVGSSREALGEYIKVLAKSTAPKVS